MTLEQLHAIALEQAQHMDNLYLRNVPAVVLQEFATRFLAAITEKAEPVAWHCKGKDKVGGFYSYVVGGKKPAGDDYLEVIPLYPHPASELALQQEDHTPRYCSEHPAVCAAQTSGEVKWTINHLRAIGMLQAADMIEHLARQER